MEIDFFVSSAPEPTQALLGQAAEGLGYQVEPQADGSWKLSRGSAVATALLGGLAGKKQLLRYSVFFFFQAEGQSVVRLSRPAGHGVAGGAIGVSRSAASLSELDQAIGQALSNAGVLANVVRS